MNGSDDFLKSVTNNHSKAVEFFSGRLGFLIAPSKLKEHLDQSDPKITVIDVRHHDSYNESRVPSAIFVDADDLDSQWELFSRDTTNVIYCYSELCHRAARVCLAASLKGFAVMELHGGFEGWAEYPMRLEK